MLGTVRASYILGDHLQPPNNVSILFYFPFKTESCYAAQVGPLSLCLSHPPASASEYGGQQAPVTLPSEGGFLMDEWNPCMTLN